jgi:L-alanine-DL-glutamate epimerase-like enolase superfamily enzyme
MKITDLTVQNFRYPMSALHRARFGGEQAVSLVAITTDAGVTGHGMARAQGGMSGAPLAEALLRTVRPLLVGEHPLDRERLWQRLFALERAQYAPMFVTSAVDVALWDIAGQVMGQPIYRVLGGYRDRILAYASSAYYDSIEAYVADAQQAVARGFRAYKLHPFGQPDRDIELCAAVRAAVGPAIRLMLDVTGGYNRADALRVGRAIERLGFHWYEEPLSHYDYEGNRELRLALDIPVVGAETMAGSAYSGATYVAQGAFDAILCDVYWKMGITGMMKLARTCETMHLPIASHHAGSALMNVANLHCLCATPNVDMIEVLVPEADHQFGLQSYPVLDADGRVVVPAEPGLGVVIDTEYMRSNAEDAPASLGAEAGL